MSTEENSNTIEPISLLNSITNQNEKNNMSLDPFREDNNKDEINQNNQSNISKAADDLDYEMIPEIINGG